MKRLLVPTILVFADLLGGASCQTAQVSNPCDVLVAINPKPETNSYLVANDRPAAMAIAQHRGRFGLYKCAGIK